MKKGQVSEVKKPLNCANDVGEYENGVVKDLEGESEKSGRSKGR